MGVPFQTFYAGLPPANTPQLSDTVLLLSAGTLSQMSFSQFLSAMVPPPFMAVDANIQNSIDLAGYTYITVAKKDATALTIAIIDSSGNTVPVGPLSVQGETCSLRLNSGVWYVV